MLLNIGVGQLSPAASCCGLKLHPSFPQTILIAVARAADLQSGRGTPPALAEFVAHRDNESDVDTPWPGCHSIERKPKSNEEADTHSQRTQTNQSA
jgi:hypothetical protein